MSGPRVAASVLVSALIRAAEGQGGFGAVLSKGDATAGAILILLVERGGPPQILERVLTPTGDYRWQRTENQAAGNAKTLQKFLQRRRQYDPDLWVLELDVPSAERFAAEMSAFD